MARFRYECGMIKRGKWAELSPPLIIRIFDIDLKVRVFDIGIYQQMTVLAIHSLAASQETGIWVLMSAESCGGSPALIQPLGCCCPVAQTDD